MRPPVPLRGPLRALLAVLVLATGERAAHAHDLEPPKPLEQPAAPWPGGIASWHDVVVPVTLLVRADGTVGDVSLDAGVSPDFDSAALATARAWKFAPALRAGTPVEAKIRAAVRFVGSRERPSASLAPAPPAAATATMPPTPVTVVGHGEEQHAVHEVSVQGDAPVRSASEVVRKRDVLKAAPHRTGSDLLLTVPGVFITQHSGEGKAHQIFLRGFDAVHGQDLELWAGGAPVNDVSNVHGQGYADLHFLMPEVVREIRSTPGTYDPRQGDFAVAGTIRIGLGLDTPGITTKVTAGSFGSRRIFVGYHPAGEPEGTFGAFETYSTDGFGPQRAATRSSAMGQMVFAVGTRAQGRVLASAYATRFDTAGVVRLADIERTNDDGLRRQTYTKHQGGDSSRGQLVLELSEAPDAADDVRWSVTPYLVLRNLRLRQDFTGFLVDPENGDTSQQLNRATTAGFTSSYRRKVKLFSANDAVEAGVSGRQDWIEQSQLRLRAVDDRVARSLVNAKVQATDVAGYLDAELHPLRRVTLRGGVRVDGLAYSTQDFVNGATTVSRAAEDVGGQGRTAQGAFIGKKGTIDVLVAGGLHALASYGEGFRSPQARSLGDGERAPFTRVVSYEAGVRYRDGQRLEASAAAFHTDLSDDLVFDQETARNERVAATKRDGLAIEGTARPERWLLSSMSFTYTRAAFRETQGIYESGALVPYVPQIIARSDLAVTPRFGSWRNRSIDGRIGTGLTFLHRRPLPYSEIGHDIFLVDATASVRFGTLELGLDAFNLLDAQWFDGEFVFASRFDRSKPASLVPARHVTVGAPRTILASLAITLLRNPRFKPNPEPMPIPTCRLPVVASLAFCALASLSGCAEDDAKDSTSQKRIALTVTAASPPEARVAFVNAYQWTITLSKAEIAIGALYFFDGEPIFSWRAPPQSPRERLASLFIGTAHAHPGHYIAGSAVGQVLTSSSLSLLGEGITLGTGDGVTGAFRSGRVTFPDAPAGPVAGDLGDKIALFEGVARKNGKSVGFRLSAARSQLLDADGAARVEGCTVLPATEVTGDKTITLVIDPRKIFDQAEFDGLPEGETPADIPATADASVNFLRGVKSGPTYVFTVPN